MREDVKVAWVERLRDPEQLQATGALRRTGMLYEQTGRSVVAEVHGDDPDVKEGKCCLGVLCDVLADKFPDIVIDAEWLEDEFGYKRPPARDDDPVNENYGYYCQAQLNDDLLDAIGLDDKFQNRLARCNDGTWTETERHYGLTSTLVKQYPDGVPFSVIADMIESQA